MAGGELYGVWGQTITNDTTAANVEKYGEIEDMAQAYRDGFAKDFCDGQTSPTPPRWPDDGMQLIYTYSREGAEMMQEFLRGGISERIAEGALQPQGGPPAWLGDIVSDALSAAATHALAVEVSTALAADEAGYLTAGQIEARMADYIAATGNRKPTAAEVLEWIRSRE